MKAFTLDMSLDALELSEGDTVLVVGATGGVGSFAVQLADHSGMTVIAIGLPKDEDYLRDLGADEVIDRNGDIAAAAREAHPDGVNGLVELVSYSPDDFNANAGALKEGGRGASPLSAAGDGPGRTNVMALSTSENVGRIAHLLEAGALRAPIQATYPLARAGDALRDLDAKHNQGKLAISIS